MLTFTISWSNPSGKFGWTDITECVDMEDAIEHFNTHVLGVETPADITIDRIRRH